MSAMEIFIWAIAGGLLVAVLSASAVLYQKDTPSRKQLSRDFLLGAAFTGFLYPIIPETFDEVKGALTTTAGGLQESLASKIATATNTLSVSDPGVKIGPANF